MITKPMLAGKLVSVNDLVFKNVGYLVTPKFDGIRCLKINGQIVSRTFKLIPNDFIRDCLSVLPDNADGELISGNTFQDTTSAVMTKDGEPEFTFYWFDYVKDNLETTYAKRVQDMVCWCKEHTHRHIVCVLPKEVKTIEEFNQYEMEYINAGYEGIILRTPDSPYKCGRATSKSQWLLKFKRFEDAEAIIIGFTELLHNNNPAQKDSFGNIKRTTHKINQKPRNLLGSLCVKDITTNVEFEIGTGFDLYTRKHIWENQKEYLGKIVKYKYFAITGMKDKPRFPSFIGIRDKRDT